MSTMPRWPELFPDMKVRGGRRRAGQRRSQKTTKHIADMRKVGEAMQAAMDMDWTGIFSGLSESIRAAASALGELGRLWFDPAPAEQRHYALFPVPEPLFELPPEEYKIVSPRHTGIDMPELDHPAERIARLLDNLRPADSAPVMLWDERDELDALGEPGSCAECGHHDGHSKSCTWFEWDEVDPWDARPDTGCSTCDGGGCGDCA